LLISLIVLQVDDAGTTPDEAYSKKLSAKADHTHSKGRFLPHATLMHTTLQDETNGTKLKRTETTRKRPDELMPMPDVTNNSTKLVSLEESIKIQRNYESQMKELRLQQAVQRLTAQRRAADPTVEEELKFDLKSYRTEAAPPSDEEEEAEEEEEEGDGGGKEKGIRFAFSEYE